MFPLLENFWGELTATSAALPSAKPHLITEHTAASDVAAARACAASPAVDCAAEAKAAAIPETLRRTAHGDSRNGRCGLAGGACSVLWAEAAVGGAGWRFSGPAPVAASPWPSSAAAASAGVGMAVWLLTMDTIALLMTCVCVCVCMYAGTHVCMHVKMYI